MNSKDNKIKELEANIRKLESELKDEKNKNNILLAENKQLKQENSQMKNKINSYDNQQNINNNLLNEIKKLHKLQEQTIQSHNQLFNSITKLGNNNSNLSNNSNDSIIKLIKDKEDEIKDLKKKLKRYPFILEKNEKIMSIIFSSLDEKINCSLLCKNTDNINKIEKQLYKEYPNLFENQNYIFLCKGKIINRYQTFESNHIKNGDIIILNSNEDSGLFK